jgi:hypothetical protein
MLTVEESDAKSRQVFRFHIQEPQSVAYTVCSMGGLLISFIHFLIYFLLSCRSCFIEGYFYKITLTLSLSPARLRHTIFLFWNRLRL